MADAAYSGLMHRSAARNQQQSPLLRLPGEIRNRIYEYALGGVILYVYRPSKSPKPYHLLVRQAGSSLSSASSTGPSHTFSLTRVSRQIHAETQHLPVPLTHFRVRGGAGSFNAFLDRLSDSQRSAITTIQIASLEAYRAAHLWWHVEQIRDNSFTAQEWHLRFLEWSHSMAVDRLPGLRRVVVEPARGWPYDLDGIDGSYEYWHCLGIRRSIRGRDIEIVLEKPMGEIMYAVP
jgi:hypothetical protein